MRNNFSTTLILLNLVVLVLALTGGVVVLRESLPTMAAMAYLCVLRLLPYRGDHSLVFLGSAGTTQKVQGMRSLQSGKLISKYLLTRWSIQTPKNCHTSTEKEWS
jgi:hypothetical protein